MRQRSGLRITAFDKLAFEIRLAHGAVQSHARDSLMRAVEGGELLHRAKRQMAHGKFMPWVMSQCQFSHETANLYMRLASGWKTVQAHPNSQCVANLGLNAVDRWLRERTQPEPLVVRRTVLEKQYRSVAALIEGFLAPNTRTHELFLGVIPRLELDELDDVRGVLIDLRQRVETCLRQLDRYRIHRSDEWRAHLEADGVFDGFNTNPKLRAD